MNKGKQLIKNMRIIVMLVFLLFAIMAIHPNPYVEGVAIRAVVPNSSANIAGINSPIPTKISNNPITTSRLIRVNS